MRYQIIFTLMATLMLTGCVSSIEVTRVDGSITVDTKAYGGFKTAKAIVKKTDKLITVACGSHAESLDPGEIYDAIKIIQKIIPKITYKRTTNCPICLFPKQTGECGS